MVDNTLDNRKKSIKRENAIASALGGNRHIMSGGAWNKKGDASNETFLVEDKFTNKDSYTIHYSILDKIDKEAKKVNKIPLLSFGFDKDNYCLIESIHCNIGMVPKILKVVDKNSVTFTREELYHAYINTVLLCIYEIRFTVQDKNYYLMFWDNFLENIELFR